MYIESQVGQAIIESNIDRKDVFITTKVWNTDQGYETTLSALDISLERLETNYVDLYLMYDKRINLIILDFHSIFMVIE